MSTLKEPIKDRAIGMLIGLATGDALGTTNEFKPKGTFEPIDDMVGGGVFDLKAGKWTDDTSMALCLADSLLINKGFYPKDQLIRFCDWKDHGYNSSTNRCFDIGDTVRTALNKFRNKGHSYCGSTDESTAGNGSLMRIAPIVLYYFNRGHRTINRCVNLAMLHSMTTHSEPRAIQACGVFTAYLYKALSGKSKEEILEPFNDIFDDYFGEINSEIKNIMDGDYLSKTEDEIFGTGYVIQSLEAALWCFHQSTSFEHGALLAANLGDDADTTTAIYGQLAGAFYGYKSIPIEWLDILYSHDDILSIATDLIQAKDVPVSFDEVVWIISLIKKGDDFLYSENVMEKFVSRCNIHNIVSPQYNWTLIEDKLTNQADVIKYVKENGINGFCTVITMLIRKNRFCEGTVKSAWNSKLIHTISDFIVN